MRLLIVSGLSGAGKSTALHVLEDLGCFCTDNLPLEMLSAWAKLESHKGQCMAVCLDTRSGSQIADLYQALRPERLRENDWHLMYIDASNETLLRRYSTLRRRHPFAAGGDLTAAIKAERKALEPVRAMASLVLDSSNTNPYELADLVEECWRRSITGHDKGITTALISFSYQRGIPLEADIVLDARFLPNPHYESGLAELTGRDEGVRVFLEGEQEVIEAEMRLQDLVCYYWPKLKRERKQYFTLAIGCSGGRHRSVYLIDRLATWMREQNISDPMIRHRELAE